MTVAEVGFYMLVGGMAMLLGMALFSAVKGVVEMFVDGDWFEGVMAALVLMAVAGFGMMALGG